MPMQETDTNATLNLILNGLTAVKGKSTTGTSTTSSNISGEGMNAMIKQILESTQGLASVASGQKSAGLYNSSTNQLLVNDLISRASGEVQKHSAGTTTTQTQKQNAQVGGKDVGTMLALQIGAKLFGPAIKEGYNKLGVDKWGDEIAKVFGLGEAADTGGTAFSLGGSSTLSDSVSSGGSFPSSLSFGGDIFGGASEASSLDYGTILSGSSSTAGMADPFGPTSSSSSTAVSSGTSKTLAASGVSGASGASSVGSSDAVYSGMADPFGPTSAVASTDVFGGSGSNLGYVAAAAKAYNASETDGDYREAVGSAILNYYGAGWATPIVSAVARPMSDGLLENGQDINGIAGAFTNEPLGAIFSGDYEFKDIVSATGDPTNTFGGNPGGSWEGFIGQSTDPVGSWFGEGIGPAIAEKVICTELNRQGLLSDRYYATCALYALSLSKETILGYHFWGVPVARYLRTSPRASKLFLYLVISRCEYLRGKNRFWGRLSVKVGEPICAFIGKFVIKSNWRTLYA